MLVVWQGAVLPCIEISSTISPHTFQTDSATQSAAENDITETHLKSLNEKNNTPGNSPFTGEYINGISDLDSPIVICVLNKNATFQPDKFSDFFGDMLYPPPVC